MNEQLINIIKQVKDKWGAETVQAIINEIDRQSIEWQGTLRRSITYEQDTGLDGDVSFFMVDYGQFQDQGVNGLFQNRGSQFSFRLTSIGGVAYHIKPWADSKGLNNWAVARSIVRKGIKPKPFFNSVIEKRLDDLGVNIENAITDYLNTSIANINAQQ